MNARRAIQRYAIDLGDTVEHELARKAKRRLAAAVVLKIYLKYAERDAYEHA
jgi:hypothetical protein